MNHSNFLHKENVNTLWDVISDEDLFKALNRDSQSQILQVFSNNIKGFFENEKTKTTNLIEMNKKYIVLILNYIKNNFAAQKHNKIKIYEEAPVKELITYEEIQNDRKSQFEKDLGKLQEEFTNSMTLPVPEVPVFADNYEETPISEMDKMIKEMTVKRNYEVEQINRSHLEFNNNNHNSSNNNWLKPQETSIKTEKFMPPTSAEANPTPSNQKRFKFLNIEEEPTSPKKTVTWDLESKRNDIINLGIKDEQEENIFKKLKKVNNNGNEPYNTNDQRLTHLEKEIAHLNQKMDIIIDLLKQNK